MEIRLDSIAYQKHREKHVEAIDAHPGTQLPTRARAAGPAAELTTQPAANGRCERSHLDAPPTRAGSRPGSAEGSRATGDGVLACAVMDICGLE